MHELFEHTADLGLRVQAGSLNELFAEAGRCLFSAIIENPEAIEPKQTMTVSIAGTDREFLLFDWLRELLYRFDSEHFLGREFIVRVSDSGLEAEIRGEPIDPARHLLSHEVKAITYHDLSLVQDSQGEWQAEVIVDI